MAAQAPMQVPPQERSPMLQPPPPIQRPALRPMPLSTSARTQHQQAQRARLHPPTCHPATATHIPQVPTRSARQAPRPTRHHWEDRDPRCIPHPQTAPAVIAVRERRAPPTTIRSATTILTSADSVCPTAHDRSPTRPDSTVSRKTHNPQTLTHLRRQDGVTENA